MVVPPSTDDVRCDVVGAQTPNEELMSLNKHSGEKKEEEELVCSSEEITSATVDPWSTSDMKNTSPKWSDLSCRGRLQRVFVQGIAKVLVLVVLLYFFICSLDLLCSAFKLLGGRAAGAAFSNSQLLSNPVAGLMIGVLATVLVQSSSTSTSIVVTMVASGMLQVQLAIPIIMGANIGTSLTNTIVALAQSSDRDEFRRAFGGATVHDMFNWLTVLVLLPLEMATGYLYHLTGLIVRGFNMESVKDKDSGGATDWLKVMTSFFTEMIIQLNKRVVEGIALNDPHFVDQRLIKTWCGVNVSYIELNVTDILNRTSHPNITTDEWTRTSLRNVSVSVNVNKCQFLFNWFGLADVSTGVILLIGSLLILCGCLILMVKVLNSALGGSVMTVIKKVINYDLPGYASYLSGYVAMMVGAGMTIVVQSSSVFTSTLTPLVGVGVITIERMYPLTLGSNIGTTTTGLLAAMAASNDQLRSAIQIALVHLCFNVTGILLFYPIPQMRIPLKLAKMMGNTTANYRWFAVLYVLIMFFLLPLFVFLLSMISIYLLISVLSLTLTGLILVTITNLLQCHSPLCLPEKLRTWDFLPLFMHSLVPLDRKIMAITGLIRSTCCCCTRCCLDTSKASRNTLNEETEPQTLLLQDRPPSDDFLLEKELNSYISSEQSFPSDDTRLQTKSRRGSGAGECESGYASKTTTPHNTPFATPMPTPCISRYPSFAVIREHEEERIHELSEESVNEALMVVFGKKS